VVIESIWIDKYIDLSHDLITSGIGDIPVDILEYSDEDNVEDEEVGVGDNNERVGEGDFDYDIDDIVGGIDNDNYEDE